MINLKKFEKYIIFIWINQINNLEVDDYSNRTTN